MSTKFKTTALRAFAAAAAFTLALTGFAPAAYAVENAEAGAIAEVNGKTCSSFDEMVTAINETQKSNVKLLAQVEFPKQLSISPQKEVTLDLNGKQVTVPQVSQPGKSLYAIYVSRGATLHLTDSVGNGKISSRGIDNYGTMTMDSGWSESIDSDGGGSAIWNEGSLVMTGGKLSFTGEKNGNISGVALTNAGDATASISNVLFDAKSRAVSHEANSQLKMSDCVITNSMSFWNGIRIFNGSAELRNISIDSSYGGCIEVGKGATADLYDCEFSQKDYSDHNSSLLAVSGGATLNVHGGNYTGDNFGAYIFSSGGTINFYDGVLSAAGERAAVKGILDRQTYPNSTGEINIEGGTVKGTFDLDQNIGVSISGGTFTVEPNDAYLAPDCVVKANDSGGWSVEEKKIAQIGSKTYPSLSKALAEAPAGSTIKLLQDVALTSTLDIHNKDIVLDLNGHKVSAAEGFSSVAINVGASGDASKASKVVLTDSSTEKTGEIDIAASKAAICVRVSSEMTISNARIVYTGTKKGNDGSLSNNPAIQNQGKLTLNSGASVTSNTSGATVFGPNAVFEMNDGASIVADAMQALSGNGSQNGTSITINGGSIESKKSAGIYHPQEGALTLNGGLITGDVGVQVCGGELVVPENSTVVVTATGSDRRPDKKSDDGDIPDGAALSLINRDGYPAGTPVANVAGGTFTSEQGDSVLAYAWSKDGESSEWMAAADSVDIVGGIYSKEFDKSLLGKDFALHADGDKYTVVKASGQAEGEDVSGAITVKPSHPALKPSIKPAVGDKLAESAVAAGESLLKGDGVQGMSVNNEEELKKVAARVDEAKGDTLEATLSFNLNLLESAPKDEAEIIDQNTAAGEKASYLDISVVLNVAAVKADGTTIASASSGVTELGEPLEITVSVLDADLTGSVRLARVHEGTFEFIPCTVNAEAGTITFTTDRFSTYVLLTSNSVEVTFESNGGSSVAAQTVKYGEKVTKPADPTRAGFTFDAWYSDKELTKLFDFNKALDPKTDEPAMTLYAKWTEVEKPGPKPEQPIIHKVTFVPVVGEDTTIVVTVEDGEFVEVPGVPAIEGYKFAGWFYDKDYKKPFDAEKTRITEDLTLYGGWYKDDVKNPLPPTTPQKPVKPAPKPDLPQTGDDSMLPIIALGLGGFAVIAAGVVLSRKNKK